MAITVGRTAYLAAGKYGQVEPNHLSAQRTGQIYAQLCAASGINTIENGQFFKYDYATAHTNGDQGQVNFTGAGEWLLCMNEVKLYDVRQTLGDFAMIKTEATEGELVPRLYKTNIGDIFTTNTVANASYALLDVLTPGSTGILEKDASPDPGDPLFQVIKLTTMPDGSEAVKVMRIPDVNAT